MLSFQKKTQYNYLDTFLKEIDSQFEYGNNTLEIYPSYYYKNEYKDIDILLIDRLTQHAIIIENKIYARDSNHEDEGQLEKYYRIIVDEEKINEKNVEIYYMTLDGHDPSEQSIFTSKKYPQLKEKVCCISYSNEIKNWLTICAKEAYNEPFQRETILQYLKLIKTMTNDVDIEERIEIKRLIGESQNNLKSAKLLIDNLKHLHWHTISDFWDNLADSLKAKGFEILSQPQAEDFDTIVHGGERKRKQVCLHIDFKTNLTFNAHIEENYYDQLGYGVNFAKQIPKKTTKVFSELCEKFEKYSSDDKWAIVVYPLSEQEELNSWEIENDATFQMINPEFQHQTINKIVRGIEQFLIDYESINNR